MSPRSPRPRPSRTARLVTTTACLLGTAVALAAAPALTLPGTADEAVSPAASFRPQLVTVDTPTGASKQRLSRLGLDLTEHAGRDYVEVVLHSAAELAALTTGGFTYDVRIPDLVARQAEINAVNKAYAKATVVSKLPSGRDAYRTLADYNADMAALAKAHPKVVKQFALKRPSVEGKVVNAVEIGEDVTKPASGRPTFVLMGLHHAREWPSGELAMEFATDLAKSYGKDERITSLLRKARVIVVPVVNVDGFDLSRTDGEYVDLRDLNGVDPLGGTGTTLATPGQAYKRKNCSLGDGVPVPPGLCRATAASPGGFGVGVDLNRNYGGFWGGPGASTTPADPTYRGPEAFSEPETQNIRDLVAERQVTMLISNHTFSNLVLRPNGVAPTTIASDGIPVGDAPDEKGLKALGAKFAAANGYQNIHGWQLYDTTGTTEDWSYNATGGYGYTFEIGANEFHPPFPEVVDEYLGAGKYAGKGNREAYLKALEHAVDTRFSGRLTGKAPAGTVLTLSKKFVTPTWEGGFDDSVSASLTVPRTGRFSWIVNPSTRPVVQPRPYKVLASKPSSTKTYEGTVAPLTNVDHEFTVTKTADVLSVDLDWPTPDDLDLEVYKKQKDGSLVEVGSSGNSVGEKEKATILDATPGTYVLRVINFASVTPSYTLTAGTYAAQTKLTKGKTERYTLTCSRGGKVKLRTTVLVDRGQVRALDLRKCR